MSMFSRRNERGNVFFTMFGAVALVGAVGAASMQVMKGPVRAMSEVTKRTVAENNMIASTKLAVMAATNQAGGGDCDGDMIVEPIPAEDPAGLAAPSGGGLLPATIGASLQDPWSTRYALCAWDHGANNGRCGGQAGLIAGGPTEDQYVLAVISAGPDRQFQTSCNAWVDANTDNQPDVPLLVKPVGSDDLVLGYTYAEANSAGGGLWVLKSGDPDKATIVKDLEVRTADDSQVAFALDRSTGEAEFLALKTDSIYARTSPNGHVAMQDPLRIKTIIGLAAPPSSGGGGMAALPNGQTWIGDAADEAQPQTLSGDATLSNTGVLTIGNNAITAIKIANDAVTSAKIADGTIVNADIANTTITVGKISAGGTANGSTFLRGDGQWAAAGGGGAGCAGGRVHMQVWTSGWFACDNALGFHQCQNGTIVNLGAVPGGSCAQACFGAGSQVLLAGGGAKAIEALEIGDKVIGRGGVTNTVIALKPTTLGDRKLYTINGTLKVTADHPAMTDRGWGVISRALYAQRYFNRTIPVTVGDGQKAIWETSFIPPEEMVEFGVGDKIAFGNSRFQKITSLTSEILPADTPLYTVALDGDGTFQLEGGYVFIGLSGGLAGQKQVGVMSAKEIGALQSNKKEERAAWERQD